MVEKAGDGKGADAADRWRDGGEVGARTDVGRDIAFQNAFFGSGAGVNYDGVGLDHFGSDEARHAGSSDDDIIIYEV